MKRSARLQAPDEVDAGGGRRPCGVGTRSLVALASGWVNKGLYKIEQPYAYAGRFLSLAERHVVPAARST